MIATAEKYSALGLGDYVAILRRRWLHVVVTAPAVILMAAYFAYSLPAEYRSTATIMLEPSSVPKEVIETTVVSYANHQIEIVQSRVMTLEAIKQLVAEMDPYPDEPKLGVEAKAQRVIENTSFERVDPVTMKTLQESTAFSLHYDNPDPKRAAAIAMKLADLFVTYNQRTRTEAAKQAAGFLAQQTKGITEELRAADAQLAQLKMKYGDALPDSQRSNEAKLDGARRDLESTQREVRVAEEKETLLSLQLNEISPNLIALGGDLTDLGKVKAQLAEAEQKYTPDHPDVKRLRRAMSDLIARNAERGSKVLKPNNPEYLRVAGQLGAARRELAALRESAARTRQQIYELTRDITTSPIAEREFSEVSRRREALLLKFQQLQGQLQSAQLAQSFESESRGERFTLVRAPYEARSPVFPNRIGLILLGCVLGGVLAAAAVTVAESADTSVRGPTDLPALAGVELLGTIPVILTAGDRRRRAIVLGCVAGAYGIAILIVGITAAFSV